MPRLATGAGASLAGGAGNQFYVKIVSEERNFDKGKVVVIKHFASVGALPC
jgi:hypothetical protein